MGRLNQTKRIAQLSLVLISLILNQLPAGGQTRRSGVPSGKPQPPAKPAAESHADGKPTALLSSVKSEEMAAPFNTGKLPEPLRKPSGSIDEVAAALAKQVSARDESSVPALLTAILTAGFGLRDKDGSVLQTVDPGQGLVFDAWEVAAMAKMYGENRSTPLTYLTDGLKSIPELKTLPLDSILLEGIRKHAQGEQPLLRFWARFIVELGRQQDESYDILKGADLKGVRLDAVQSALILHRLIGDFYALGQSEKQASRVLDKLKTRSTDIVLMQDGGLNPHFVRASFWEGSSASVSMARMITLIEKKKAAQPCEGLGGDPVQDVLATELTNAWGSFFGDTKLGKAVSIANIVLAYAKFIASYAALETKITIDSQPLIRTTNTTPGRGKHKLTATVKMNIGKWDQINCYRSALNLFTGLDFNLLDDGPLEGVEVNWHLDEGGAGDRYSNSTGFTRKEQIVGFVNKGPRIQDAGAYAGIPGKPGTPVSNFTRTKTDKEGKAQVEIQGSPKKNHVAEPYMPVMKQAAVRTTIKMKGGDIKGDAADLWGQLRGGLPGLATLPLELLYRTDWASSAYLVVPVEDHEPCEGQWYGTITYTQTFKDERSFQEENQRGNWNREESYEATVEFTNERLNPEQRVASYAAKVKAKASYSETRYGRGTSKVLCNLENNMTTNGSGNYEGVITAGVLLTPDGGYRIHNVLPSVSIIGQMTKSRKILECKNPFIKPSNSSGTVNRSVSPEGLDIEGMVDPKNPNVLKGSKTVSFPERNGTKTGTLTWNLVRCGR